MVSASMLASWTTPPIEHYPPLNVQSAKFCGVLGVTGVLRFLMSLLTGLSRRFGSEHFMGYPFMDCMDGISGLLMGRTFP